MSTYRYALSGLNDVTNTYNLRSNFLPPIRRGLSMYRDITYVSLVVTLVNLKSHGHIVSAIINNNYQERVVDVSRYHICVLSGHIRKSEITGSHSL